MTDKKKQTGRTGRMLKHAHQMELAGKTVYVIASSISHAEILQERLNILYPGTTIRVKSPMLLGFDWKTLSLLDADPNTVVLVDHYAIECCFGNLLEMWTRYDQQENCE